MITSSDLYNRLPEAAKTHIIRDATFQQGIYLAMWFIPALLLFPFGLAPVSAVLMIYGVYGAWPTMWGPRYLVRRDKRSDRRIRRRNHVAFDPHARGKAAKWNYLIPFRLYDFGTIGTIYNFVRNTDTIIIRVSGREGIFADVEDRYAYEQQIIEVLKTTISQVASNIVFSLINGRRPYDNARLADNMVTRFLHASVLNPLTEIDKWLREQHDENVANTERYGAMKVSCFALTVPRPREWRKYKMATRGANPALIPGSDIDRLIQSIVPGLENAGYLGVEVLGAAQLHELAFKTWNLAYVTRRVIDAAEDYHPDKLEWPTRIIAHDEWLDIEGSAHAVFLAKRFRSNMILPGGLIGLLTIRAWVYVSACSLTISPTLEAWILDRSTRFREAFSKTSNPDGTYENVKDIDRREAPRVAFNLLYFSRSKAIRLSDPFVVSGINKAQLDENIKVMEAKLREERIEAIRVDSPTRLLRIFFAATLGLRT